MSLMHQSSGGRGAATNNFKLSTPRKLETIESVDEKRSCYEHGADLDCGCVVSNQMYSDNSEHRQQQQQRKHQYSATELAKEQTIANSQPDGKSSVLSQSGCDADKEEEEDDEVAQKQILLRKKSDRRRIRANVVLELINSERDFVKHLKDVVEGYLFPARRHPEIFTAERINTIFANIEQLYEFQRQFLDSLERCINWNDLASSQVGHCFLKYEKGFSVYHYYCNNHPNVIGQLQDLYTQPRFVKFFEACRLLQNMIDISLDGFLLTPIQRICKYPLQLNELLKNTEPDHLDYRPVCDALESMRNCANAANERKRRIEALADIMLFQERVENWQGPNLSDTSSILIHSGEVSNMGSHTWSQGMQLYLFDHLLLLAKRDLLKRNSVIFKGRVCMDNVTRISDADEYKPKKSFKLYCGDEERWLVFTTKSEKDKDEWIGAFERERNLVEADKCEGFEITKKEIGIARRALQHGKHSRSARYRHKRVDNAIVDQIDLDDANLIMNRTLSLPSCIHPSHVMNFVEESRVISTRKKDSAVSPRSSSRSPLASSAQQLVAGDTLDRQQTCQTDHSLAAGEQLVASSALSNYAGPTGSANLAPSTGGWFKKMGSKKLAKSQVYIVNDDTGQPASVGSLPSLSRSLRLGKHTGPASGGAASSLAPSVGASDTPSISVTYDQLEKRHRDHMISEEQARLFRLNNNLCPTASVRLSRAASPAAAGPKLLASHKPLTTKSAIVGAGLTHKVRTTANFTHDNDLLASSIRSMSLCDGAHRVAGLSVVRPHLSKAAGGSGGGSESGAGVVAEPAQPDPPASSAEGQCESAFEATVVLSSGRIVQVREDSV